MAIVPVLGQVVGPTTVTPMPPWPLVLMAIAGYGRLMSGGPAMIPWLVMVAGEGAARRLWVAIWNHATPSRGVGADCGHRRAADRPDGAVHIHRRRADAGVAGERAPEPDR